MLRKSALISALLATVAAAQTRPAWDGAFTAADAFGGRTAFRDNCVRCHGIELGGGENSPALVGANFLSQWAGKSAADLLDRIRRTMPTDNPGGLSNRQYTDLVAYLISANGFRAGV